MEQPKRFSMSSNLQMRIISAVILAPLILAIVAMGGWLFNALVMIVAIMIAMEWEWIVTSKNVAPMLPERLRKWRVVGVIYAAIFGVSMIFLRELDGGLGLVFYLLIVVWMMDIGAYFTGRFIGGPKIAPSISPKKTWSGLMGGMVASGFAGGLFSFFMVDVTFVGVLLISMVLGFISQVGDFIESRLKRQFNVKDSGAIIPGHGGVMDRVDSLVLGAPFLVLVQWLYGGVFF